MPLQLVASSAAHLRALTEVSTHVIDHSHNFMLLVHTLKNMPSQDVHIDTNYKPVFWS